MRTEFLDEFNKFISEVLDDFQETDEKCSDIYFKKNKKKKADSIEHSCNIVFNTYNSKENRNWVAKLARKSLYDTLKPLKNKK